jgi:hypothetical protein
VRRLAPGAARTRRSRRGWACRLRPSRVTGVRSTTGPRSSIPRSWAGARPTPGSANPARVGPRSVAARATTCGRIRRSWVRLAGVANPPRRAASARGGAPPSRGPRWRARRARPARAPSRARRRPSRRARPRSDGSQTREAAIRGMQIWGEALKP